MSARNLADVIDAMLPLVPDTEARLRHELEGIRSSVAYTAPEAMGARWHRTIAILADALGDTPAPGWPSEVAAIFNGDRPS